MARQSEWISLCGAIGGDDEGATSATSGDGTLGHKAHRDRDRDVDRVRALFLAFSNYDYVITLSPFLLALALSRFRRLSESRTNQF